MRNLKRNIVYKINPFLNNILKNWISQNPYNISQDESNIHTHSEERFSWWIIKVSIILLRVYFFSKINDHRFLYYLFMMKFF